MTELSSQSPKQGGRRDTVFHTDRHAPHLLKRFCCSLWKFYLLFNLILDLNNFLEINGTQSKGQSDNLITKIKIANVTATAYLVFTRSLPFAKRCACNTVLLHLTPSNTLCWKSCCCSHFTGQETETWCLPSQRMAAQGSSLPTQPKHNLKWQNPHVSASPGHSLGISERLHQMGSVHVRRTHHRSKWAPGTALVIQGTFTHYFLPYSDSSTRREGQEVKDG